MELINLAKNYNVYLSYSPDDAEWVQDILLPKLISAQIHITISGTVQVPGVIHVMDREQSILQARWIIAVLSPSYLVDQTASSELLFAGGVAIKNDSNYLIPILIKQIDQPLPPFLQFIKTYDLTNHNTIDSNMNLLVQMLKDPPEPIIGAIEQREKPKVSSTTATTALQYDVFVSYSQLDQNWVQHTLLSRLEAAGLLVCIDFRDFSRSLSALSENMRAVQTSRRTILILTNNYMKRDWNQLEQVILGSFRGDEGQLILLVQAGLYLPTQLNHYTIIYFETPERRQRTWNRVIQALLPDASANASASYSYDVCVTCAQADHEWVRNEILPQLETNNLRVYIDLQSVDLDKLVTEDTERGLRNSRNTLLVLTRSYLQERWSTFDTLLLRLPIHHEGRLIPLVDAGCPVPMRISQLTAAYFVRDIDQMWQGLLKVLRDKSNE